MYESHKGMRPWEHRDRDACFYTCGSASGRLWPPHSMPAVWPVVFCAGLTARVHAACMRVTFLADLWDCSGHLGLACRAWDLAGFPGYPPWQGTPWPLPQTDHPLAHSSHAPSPACQRLGQATAAETSSPHWCAACGWGPGRYPGCLIVSITPQGLPQGWPPLTSCTLVICARPQAHKHQGSAYFEGNPGRPPPRTQRGCSHCHKDSASDTCFICFFTQTARLRTLCGLSQPPQLYTEWSGTCVDWCIG